MAYSPDVVKQAPVFYTTAGCVHIEWNGQWADLAIPFFLSRF